MATLSPQDEVIHRLIHDPNSARIKKLLIYVCQHYWESDATRLKQVEMPDLVQELMAIAPTIEQLRFCLNNAVQTINKRAEYALIANYLVNSLTNLYSWSTPLTRVNLHPSRYADIVKTLSQDSDYIRIKKLVICACKRTWENDPTKLDSYNIVTLVQELHQLTVTPENLSLTLQTVVDSLNRSDVYQPIAERICQACRSLYYPAPVEPQNVTAFGSHTTQIQFNGDRINTSVMTAPVETSPTSNSSPSVISDKVEANSEMRLPEALPQPKKTFSNLLNNLFDLRLEIIKYANPLRAKTLIYSLMHGQPELNAEIWSAIKNYDLETLLQNLFRVHKRFSYLETSLTQVAQGLPSAPHYLQTSAVILRAIKPYYLGSVEGLSLAQDDAIVPTQSFTADSSLSAKPTDLTCQFSAAAEVSEFTRAIANPSDTVFVNSTPQAHSHQPIPDRAPAHPTPINDATLAVPPISPS